MLIEHLPEDSAFVRAVRGDEAPWTLANQLLAAIADLLAAANWQRGGDKHARRPDPLPRPGVSKPDTIGHGALPVDELRARLRPTRKDGD